MIFRTQDYKTEESAASAAAVHRSFALIRRPAVHCAALIALCFLLTSTGWLAWEYHLLELASSGLSDWMTMVAGYVLQAAGIGAFAMLLRRRGLLAEKLIFAMLILYALCLIPSVLSRKLAGTLAAGLLSNLLCGYIAGFYLHRLSVCVPANRRATALGVGYSLSILASWLLSRLGGGTLYYSNRVWFVCLGLTVLILLLLQCRLSEEDRPAPAAGAAEEPSARKTMLITVAGVILLFSVVNNCGFAFSSADLLQGIRVESSRLFYAAGMILAGIVSDSDRKHGAVAALAALILPFIMLALRHEPVSLTVFWELNYFAFGFYSVFRIIVFSDLAEKHSLLPLAAFGLLVGRLGDAAGEGICLSLTGSALALIFFTALLAVSAIFLFFRVYRPLYAPEAAKQQSEEERFYQFAVAHDLSAREREMLRLVLQEKTNGEIADALSISENTVKFHIHNLLQKTGCRNKNDLIAAYIGRKQA